MSINPTEQLVFERLSALNMNPIFTKHHAEFDILCQSNNLRIEVKKAVDDKTSWKIFLSEGVWKDREKYSGIYKKKNSSFHYRHGNRWYKDYTKSCDYIVALCGITFFIIPAVKTKDLGRMSLGKLHTKKYGEFEENWNLLKK